MGLGEGARPTCVWEELRRDVTEIFEDGRPAQSHRSLRAESFFHLSRLSPRSLGGEVLWGHDLGLG